MNRPSHHHRPQRGGGAGRGGFSQPAHLFPENNPFFIQNPNFPNAYVIPMAPPFTPFQNPNLPFHKAPLHQIPAFPPVGSQTDPPEALGKIETAVAKAHQDILSAGEQVTAWKVSQKALLSLQVDSWSSMGFQTHDISYLRRLMIKEGKVDAFIHCFVGSRKITSLHELDVAIRSAEGIERFEELGLGPLLQHPLVMHYFSVPPDATEVFKITSEDVVTCLGLLMDKGKKMIAAECLLNFLKEKYSVVKKEMLGVRIQSLGFFVTHIREAKKAESSTLRSSLSSLKHNSNTKGSDEGATSLPSTIVPDKLVLDRRFDDISQRIKSFSDSWKNLNTHIRFDSSEDDGDDGDDSDNDNDTIIQKQNSLQEKDISQRVSSCPYPSTYEEMTRLGMKTEVTRKRSPASVKGKHLEGRTSFGKKRKIEEPKGDVTPYMLVQFIQDMKDKKSDIKLPSSLTSSFTLDDSAIKNFITTWKDACREHSLLEVLNMMLMYYAGPLKKKRGKRLRSMIEIFSSYPGIGLLNVAVASVKCGMLDSVYDTLQLIVHDTQDDIINSSSIEAVEMIDIGPAARKHQISKRNVTTDDIIRKVSTYCESNNQFMCNDGDDPLRKTYALVKMFHECEAWLTAQFSIQEFSDLGHGQFFEFVQKNTSQLGCLVGHMKQNPSLVVSMQQNQLQCLLSQAENSYLKTGNISKDYIYVLLKKQFPTVCFHIMGDEPDKLLSEVTRVDCVGESSSCVLFSTALLGKRCMGKSTVRSEEPSLEAETTNFTCYSQFSSKDAMECLIKAPMLSDLLSWSHWDLLYAPSMGPLMEWLLNGMHHKELLCIATSDGKLIRIDPTATADDFLEAAIQGSSFQAAVKLLSLLSLYGGVDHVPMSLLKHFAQRAIEIKIRNCADCTEVKSLEGSKHLKPFQGKHVSNGGLDRDISAIGQTNKLQESKERAFSAASNFILDCLAHLPSEFHSFAAEILMSGLQSFTKDAYLVMLHGCKKISHRLMLHNIGLTIGIIEWIEDYNSFCSQSTTDFGTSSQSTTFESSIHTNYAQDASERLACADHKLVLNSNTNPSMSDLYQNVTENSTEILVERAKGQGVNSCGMNMLENRTVADATLLIESIRREEFGLDPNLEYPESSLLKKQHARLGRALHCLSQELYSQDSHLLLELIQNADDNSYPQGVEPTLSFILQANGIIVLNNEQGFSAQNIRALCDIGNSTKKGSGSGYIGNKGIGFKSVFRITDAPEIHSNGFHVKFDISEGQIGFVLPTNISPCDVNAYMSQSFCETDQHGGSSWNTCIVLPFRAKLKDGAGISSIVSLFLDLHPSLLLFLHRLQCIKFRDMLNDTLVMMKRETLEDGIVRVSHGNEKTSWLVVRKQLPASLIRADVQTTEIAVAFTLQESDNGWYIPNLTQQPVFAFLPLRQYGLKFILQGDFVLPSSREEVDGDSAWNQWLLSEFPTFFVDAERSFCALPCYKDSPGKAVSTFLSFVPLVGEVHGFFSQLPNMIISKLRVSNCLLLEDLDTQWVPPCRALRGWDDQARHLLSDILLQQHLGLGFLRKDIVLSDALARSLGVINYGPKILIDILSSMCQINGGIKLLSFDWLSSWLIVLNIALSAHSVGYMSTAITEFDVVQSLKQISFIPLSGGSYGSVADGHVWLPFDSFTDGCEGNYGPKDFPCLYGSLRIVDPLFLSAEMSYVLNPEERRAENLKKMLLKVGVQQQSAHEIIKTHILHRLSDDSHLNEEKSMMAEYLSFVMLHFQSDCRSCSIEKEDLILELQKKPIILTDHGYKCPIKEPIHFSKEYGNLVNMNRLLDHEDNSWHQLDSIYLNHTSTRSLTSGIKRWREFFMGMGITDFVQVAIVEKNVPELPTDISVRMIYDSICDTSTSRFNDSESLELVHLLSTISSKKCLDRCKYLLEVLDTMWDDCYGVHATGYIISEPADDKKIIRSSFMKSIHSFKWVPSSIDNELHFPKDLYHDCEAVRSILGVVAPYAVPQVNSKKLVNDIGFKTQVTLGDALRILRSWNTSDGSFMASTTQMSKFYTFIWDNIPASKQMILDELKSCPWIFTPCISKIICKDIVCGSFSVTSNVYWHDPTGSIDLTKEMILGCDSATDTADLPCKALCMIYPGLHDFFVNECGVHENPPFSDYMDILLQLSSVSLPSQAAHAVFRIFLKMADDLTRGTVKPEVLVDLKARLSELGNTVLPTMQDQWVSLHPTFGLICWCDDEELRLQFRHSDNVDFLQFGDLNNDEKDMLCGKVALLMQKLGVPALSEVVSREAIFYGTDDNEHRVLLVNWVLPYAQRYLFKLHPEIYPRIKGFWHEKMSLLQVIVVENLFYKHTLKGRDNSSKKRFECSCLLQGNILYVTRSSDSHSMFMELSRIFFDGSSNLQLANFLHMVTVMAESGSSEEQIDAFIVNNQKVPKLPVDERVWSLSSHPTVHEKTPDLGSSTLMTTEQNLIKSSRKPSMSSNWPPTDWKNAPGFGSGLSYHGRMKSEPESQSSLLRESTNATEAISSEDISINMDTNGNWIIEDDLATTLVLPDVKSQPHSVESSNSTGRAGKSDSDTKFESVDTVMITSDSTINLASAPYGERLCHQASNEEESFKTGRLGEAAAYKYFTEKLGPKAVRWVNKELETGLPYDLLIGETEEKREYIEVKSTRSRSKNWFSITTREWQFATEKGDAFSIARVVLLGPNTAQVSVLKNPLRLCQKNMLHLAVLMS